MMTGRYAIYRVTDDAATTLSREDDPIAVADTIAEATARAADIAPAYYYGVGIVDTLTGAVDTGDGSPANE